MSQHIIPVASPKAGRVIVTVGYDPALHEAFMNLCDDDGEPSYTSPSGIGVGDIPRLVQEQLGIALPLSVIDGVQRDVADLRTGAIDVARRMTQYNSDGTVSEAVRW
ncbi:MAG TPA: hypothetical protein VGD81_17075 [Opitutaceae bacterium]